jgi:hypothetical protein
VVIEDYLLGVADVLELLDSFGVCHGDTVALGCDCH